MKIRKRVFGSNNNERLNIFQESESLAFAMLHLVGVKQQTLSKTVRLSFFPKKDVGEISVSFFCECKKRKEAIERGKKLLASAFF